ncbi:hypothetical protein DB345_18165 [Spartobacteria bacterium LR76]|nr:hypothetical protein DB345_18165 [Spartobacteria bacterium LR76]
MQRIPEEGQVKDEKCGGDDHKRPLQYVAQTAHSERQKPLIIEAQAAHPAIGGEEQAELDRRPEQELEDEGKKIDRRTQTENGGRVQHPGNKGESEERNRFYQRRQGTYQGDGQDDPDAPSIARPRHPEYFPSQPAIVHQQEQGGDAGKREYRDKTGQGGGQLLCGRNEARANQRRKVGRSCIEVKHRAQVAAGQVQQPHFQCASEHPVGEGKSGGDLPERPVAQYTPPSIQIGASQRRYSGSQHQQHDRDADQPNARIHPQSEA